MSAVLDLYHRRAHHSTTLVLTTADGPLSITWAWNVDPHEIAKARACEHREAPWKQVLDAVTKVVDCEGALVVGPPE